MSALKSDLAAVTRTLKQLSRKTEKLAKKVDKLEKAKAAKKPKAKKTAKAKAKRKVVAKKRAVAKKSAVRRPAKQSASEVILSIMKRSTSKKGVATALLQKKTGFNNQKIRDNIYKLTKRGKIERVGRGVYTVK